MERSCRRPCCSTWSKWVCKITKKATKINWCAFMTTLMLVGCLTDEFVCECRFFPTGAFQSDIYVWTCVCFSTKTPFSTQPEMPMSEKFDLVMEYFGKMAGKMMRRLGMMRTMIIDIDWGKQYLYKKKLLKAQQTSAKGAIIKFTIWTWTIKDNEDV